MTQSDKIMLAGSSAGAAAAVLSSVCGYARATAKGPICDADFLSAKDGGFVSARGERVVLRGINMNDDLFYYKKENFSFPPRSYDVFLALKNRFGAYGASELIKKYEKNFIDASDLKYVAKLGANCVGIPLRYYHIFKKENCRGEPDFERLDYLVKKCKKLGLYVIFSLYSAPGFQNSDSAGGGDCKSELFDSGRVGFEARNAVVRFWAKLAARFKDEPAVAAYDLLSRPLGGTASWEEKTDALGGLYKRIYKAIRAADEKRVVILEAACGSETLPEAGKYKFKNAAYGYRSGFNASFETDSLVERIKAESDGKTPFIVFRTRAEGDPEYFPGAMNAAGISWLAGDYKGAGARSEFLFAAGLPAADLARDSYETIGNKWSSPLATKNFAKNKEAAKAFRAALRGETAVKIKEKRPPLKPKIKAGVGFNCIIGTNCGEKTA